MKNIGKYAVWTLFAGMLCGCIEDDNNYDYIAVNELEKGWGDIRNFDITYSVIEGEELVLAPTFKFTIDSISPDVTYAWYLNKELLEGETGPTYTFKAEKSGRQEVTFAFKDNKSGVWFAKSTNVNVRSIYQRGWTILSDEGGRSVLHFIIPTTYKYETTFEGETFTRDSLVYHDVRRDVVPNLGSNPIGLFNDIGDNDYYNNREGVAWYDELVVKQDRWVELNGNTLEHEVYTDEEFYGDIPAEFSPVEASMSYSAKALRDENGLIYWQNKVDAADFHAGAYLSVGLNNNMRFKRLFENYKFNNYDTNVMLALTEDNSLVCISDMGNPQYGETAITENTSAKSGNVIFIDDYINEENRFSKIKKEVVDAFPVPYDSWQDITSCKPFWTVILKDETTQEYELRYFGVEANDRIMTASCEEYYYENSLGTISDYRGAACFAYKRYVVIADGSQLYYYQYGWDDDDKEYKGSRIKLGEPLPDNVKKLSAFDLNSYGQNYPHDGQLGVLLEDGSFYIYCVQETKDEDGKCTAVSLKQQFPNEVATDNNFGKVVDMLYKWGRSNDFFGYNF